jgi:hypothetical protein
MLKWLEGVVYLLRVVRACIELFNKGGLGVIFTQREHERKAVHGIMVHRSTYGRSKSQEGNAISPADIVSGARNLQERGREEGGLVGRRATVPCSGE